jgi:energy-converting hydrogenase Eha subunit A
MITVVIVPAFLEIIIIIIAAFLGQPVFPEEQPLASYPFHHQHCRPCQSRLCPCPILALAVIIVIIVAAFLGVIIIIIIASFLGQPVFPEEQPPFTSLTAQAPLILGPTASLAAVPLQ